MCNHWMAAEEAAFCKQFRADPVPESTSVCTVWCFKPEFLELGECNGRFLLSTVLGIYVTKWEKILEKNY